MALTGSNIGVRQKYRKHFLSEKFLEKKFFTKINIFGIFGPKTEKMGHAQKCFFYFAHFLSNQKVQKMKKNCLPK